NEFRFTYFREAQGKFGHPVRTNLVTDSCTTAAAAFCFSGNTDTPGVIQSVTGPGGIGITPNLGASREGVPFISISGGFTIGNNFEGEIPQIGNTFQFVDNITKVWGKHTAKFGADFRIQHFDQTLYFDPNGDYTYFGGGLNDTGNLLANYLLGLPDSYLQGSAQESKYHTNAIYLYAQDSWKIRPNLTLNYGLRWEVNTPFTDSLHRVQTFNPGEATTTYPCLASSCPAGSADAVFPLGLVVSGDRGIPEGLTATYYKSFAPRIGLAWSPGTSGKTTIHAGYGIFYNPIEQLVLEQLGAEPPFGGSTLVSEGFFQAPFVLQSCADGAPEPCAAANGGVVPNPFNGFLSPTPGTAIDWARFRPILLFGQVPAHQRSQYTEQYNLAIEQQLGKSFLASVAYVGSQGHRLLGTHDLNPGNPQTCLDLHEMSILNADPSIDCGPFFADSAFTVPAGYVLPAGGLHLPYGPTGVVTGATTTSQITLVGLRPFSSPNCNPITGGGCPADGVPVFSSIFSQDTVANSAYNALQTSLTKSFSHGLQFEAAYTWSRSMDNVSTFEELLNPFCFKCGWSPSLFDARHRFVVSYYYELPVPKYEGTKKMFLNGWAISGITTYQTGFPIRILSSNDQELMNSFDFNLPGRPDLVAPFTTGDPRSNNFCAAGTGGTTGVPCQTGTYAFDPNAFADAAMGSVGNTARTICCGPGVKNWDF
ncbi:MAG TPA: TonB-dependent receptor, partial [Usitatibacter sp.]|nr:TonB-dependent receptor [Usitatibacter sp.]